MGAVMTLAAWEPFDLYMPIKLFMMALIGGRLSVVICTSLQFVQFFLHSLKFMQGAKV
jgi:hypothetical protein